MSNGEKHFLLEVVENRFHNYDVNYATDRTALSIVLFTWREPWWNGGQQSAVQSREGLLAGQEFRPKGTSGQVVFNVARLITKWSS